MSATSPLQKQTAILKRVDAWAGSTNYKSQRLASQRYIVIMPPIHGDIDERSITQGATVCVSNPTRGTKKPGGWAGLLQFQ